jgi:hypothetical protein
VDRTEITKLLTIKNMEIWMGDRNPWPDSTSQLEIFLGQKRYFHLIRKQKLIK